MKDQPQLATRNDPRWWQATSWPIWTSPPPALTLILTVIAAAVAATAVAAVQGSPTGAQYAVAGLLTAMGLLHTEIVVGIEQIRKRTFNDRSVDIGHIDLTSVWTFAAAVAVPPALSAPVTFVVLLHLWWRALRPAGNPAYRAMFSRATSMLGCFVAAGVLGAGGVQLTDGVTSVAAFGVVLVAMAGYAIVNTGLIVLAITLSQREWNPRRNLGTWQDNSLELASLGLGAVIALLLTGRSPWMVVLLLPLLIILHRAVTVQELERSADTDVDTGLLNTAAWHRDSRRELRRVARRRQSAAVVLLDLDDFRTINTVHGHQAGDVVLAETAAALHKCTRPDDVLGRYGADAFAVLLPGVDPMELDATAQRLLESVAALEVAVSAADSDAVIDGISASAGAARFPEDGLNLEEMLRTADRALSAAKELPTGTIELGAPPRQDLALKQYRRSRARRY